MDQRTQRTFRKVRLKMKDEKWYEERIFNLQNALKVKNDEIRQLVTENNNLEARIIYLEKELDYYICRYTEGRGY